MVIMKRLLTVIFIASSTFLHAQVKQGWYVGANAGMSTIDNTFSSFGADKFRPGYSADIMAGYDFGSLLSLDLSVGLGQSFAAEQNCCLQRMYIYGDDGNRHLFLPEGMTGWKYSDLYSSISFQNYQLNLNFNVLGLFRRLKASPWSLDLSPSVSAVRTSADLLLKENKEAVRNDLNSWHLGYGGKVEASYTFADRYNLGLFCDVRQLTGSSSDGLASLHSANLLSKAGVSFRFRFGLKDKKPRRSSSAAAAAQPAVDVTSALVPGGAEVAQVADDAVAVAEAEDTAVVADVASVADVAETVQAADDAVAVAEADGTTAVAAETAHDAAECAADTVAADGYVEDSRFPQVHFSFNSVWVEWNERAIVREIASILRENPSLRVKLVGWGDKIGGEEVNLRVSKQRSDAIKAALVKQQVAADRIETCGNGIKYDAPCDAEARIVQVLVEL